MQGALAKRDPLPFAYALSNHAPMYRRLPSDAEWKQAERWLGKPGSFGKLSWGNRGHEKLAEQRAIPADGGVPEFFADGGSVSRRTAKDALRRMIPLGSMLAYTRTFEHAGRTWLFSVDGTVVPADRVRPFRESGFSGVHLKGSERLPLAWIRTESRPAFVREGEGVEEATESFGVRTHVGLAGTEPVTVGRERYLETLRRDARGRALYLREKDATVVERVEKLPWGIGNDEQWIVFSITQGVLVAYRGHEPVFTTLASPGAGGVPVEGRNPVKWSTTPLGRYRVTFKHLAADMSPEKGEERKFWIADVPYTQYFNAPFAIHVAYWHENFGDPMSAGCVNVSPRDGKWLFGWTEPRLPAAWNGIAPSTLSGKATIVIIRR
jgi:lipoprotein-anchoring transpeptidase ErfK/SrfK